MKSNSKHVPADGIVRGQNKRIKCNCFAGEMTGKNVSETENVFEKAEIDSFKFLKRVVAPKLYVMKWK